MSNLTALVPDQLVSLEEVQRMFRNLVPEMLKSPQFRAMLLQTLAEEGIKPCTGACSTLPNQMGDCSVDTRLSFSRKTNLMRQNGDEFAFTDQMPIQPGESVTYEIPAFPLGRVIECFYFRPKMGDGGNPDDIKVTITGDDGVLWKVFRGGRHMSNGCCLLDCFRDDCIGWDEGFRVILENTAAVGQPPLLSAVADWNYLFPGSPSKIQPSWCWPKGRACGTC